MAEAPQQLQIVHKIGGLLWRQFRWRDQQKGFDNFGQLLEPGFILREGDGIALGKLRAMTEAKAILTGTT